MKIGYIKETRKQSLDLQTEILLSNGCVKLYQEIKPSNNIYSKSEVLEKAIEEMQANDTLMITRLSVFASSTTNLHKLLERLQSKHIAFYTIEQDVPVDKLFIKYLEIFITFEKELHYQRQVDGISSAMMKGIKFGRPIKMKRKNVIKAIRFKKSGHTSNEVARRFDVGKSTLLRYIAEFYKSA